MFKVHACADGVLTKDVKQVGEGLVGAISVVAGTGRVQRAAVIDRHARHTGHGLARIRGGNGGERKDRLNVRGVRTQDQTRRLHIDGVGLKGERGIQDRGGGKSIGRMDHVPVAVGGDVAVAHPGVTVRAVISVGRPDKDWVVNVPEEHGEPLVEAMVDADQFLVLIVDADLVQSQALRCLGGGRIRSRNIRQDILDVGHCLRIEVCQWNLRAVSRTDPVGVPGAHHVRCEVARQLRRRRIIGHTINAPHLVTRKLKRDEEEGVALQLGQQLWNIHRPTDRQTTVVGAVFGAWLGRYITVEEEVVGIEDGVPGKDIQVAVIGASSGFGNQLDLRRAAPPVLRAITVANDAELLDGIDRREQRHLIVLSVAQHVRSVQQIGVLGHALPVHRDVHVVGAARGGYLSGKVLVCVATKVHARRQLNHLLEVAGVQRKFLDLRAGDDAGLRGTLQVGCHFGFRGYGHRLVDGLDAQYQIYRDPVADMELNIVCLGDVESVPGCHHRIGANLQQGGGVVSLSVRLDLTHGLLRIGVDKRYSSAWNYRSRAVLDGAGDLASDGLRMRRRQVACQGQAEGGET